MSVAAKTHLMEILAEGDEYQLLAQAKQREPLL